MAIIIKIHDETSRKDYYMEWSTICDAPLTFGRDLESFKEYHINQYGQAKMNELAERLKRVEETGCSSFTYSLDDLLNCNRAGKDETELDKEGILEKYCRNMGWFHEDE